MTIEDANINGPGTDITGVEDAFQSGRRKAIIAGALLVPTIVTLHATPAWAQTDYTQVAYTYGINRGKCRNTNFDPNAAAGSPNSREFVKCGAATASAPGTAEGEDTPGLQTPGENF